MAISFKTYNGLSKEIISRANKALETDVKDIVDAKLKKHIQHDVYDTYDPVVYERRKENSGLIDDEQIRSVVYERTLHVYAEAPLDKPKLKGVVPCGKTALAKLIESGAHNPWNNNHYRWMKPRPFVTNTQKDINKNPGEILKAIEKRFYGGV